jgi:hypothetical protein
LAAIEAQPNVTQQLLLRRIAEAWLEGQRRAYRAEQDKQDLHYVARAAFLLGTDIA